MGLLFINHIIGVVVRFNNVGHQVLKCQQVFLTFGISHPSRRVFIHSNTPLYVYCWFYLSGMTENSDCNLSHKNFRPLIPTPTTLLIHAPFCIRIYSTICSSGRISIGQIQQLSSNTTKTNTSRWPCA